MDKKCKRIKINCCFLHEPLWILSRLSVRDAAHFVISCLFPNELRIVGSLATFFLLKHRHHMNQTLLLFLSN